MSEDFKVVVKNVNMAYPSIFQATEYKKTPEESDPAKSKFSASFLFDPTTASGKANIKALQSTCKKVAAAKWGKKIPKSLEMPLHDGDESDNAIYEGKRYFSARDRFLPLVVDRSLNEINKDDPEARIFTHGCEVNVVLTAWAQDNSFGKKVNLNLKKIQWVGKGEALKGPNQSVDGDFDELEVEDIDDIDEDVSEEDF
ncbi:MAG: ssDNA-binding protein [Fidelibacterota bacterium]